MFLKVIILSLLIGNYASALSLQKYRVTFQSNVSSGLIGSTKDAQIVITGPGLIDSSTDQPSSLHGYSVQVPFHGFSEIERANPKGFVDPFALAAMIEEGLNSQTLSLSQITEFLADYRWIEKSAEINLFKNLAPP